MTLLKNFAKHLVYHVTNVKISKKYRWEDGGIISIVQTIRRDKRDVICYVLKHNCSKYPNDIEYSFPLNRGCWTLLNDDGSDISIYDELEKLLYK